MTVRPHRRHTRTMRRLTSLVLLGLLLCLPACYKEMHLMLVIKNDGTATFTQEIVIDRASAEAQLTRFMVYQDTMEIDEEMIDEVDETPDEKDDAAPEKKTAKPETEQERKDAALARDIENYVRKSFPIFKSEFVKAKVERVEVGEKTVRVVISVTFEDLTNLVGEHQALWERYGFNRMQIEKDEQGNLRLKLTESLAVEYLFEEAMERMAETKFKVSGKVVMPGKVLSSSLPTVKDNTSSLAWEFTDAKAVAAFTKLMGEGVVVVSKPGRLKLRALPLDSAELTPEPFDPYAKNSKLKTTEAGPEFTVEALLVKSLSRHYFPEAAKLPAGVWGQWPLEGKSGCTVHGRLYAPENRRILALNSLKALEAVDERKRPLKIAVPDARIDRSESRWRSPSIWGGGRSEENNQRWVDFTLTLPLPEPDARAIEILKGEAVLTTISEWKEHQLSDPKADAKTEINLDELLPGTKLVVSKVTHTKKARGDSRHRRGSVKVKLTGPRQIRRIVCSVRIPGKSYLDTNVSEDHISVREGRFVRQATIAHTYWDNEDEPPTGKPVLVLRYPTNLKRERVKFTLKALDLF